MAKPTRVQKPTASSREPAPSSPSSPLVVVAIGGNSLIKDKDHQSVPDQWTAVKESCGHIVGLIERGWRVVITHGNGPQVGFILLRSEMCRGKIHEVPLDSIGADTQGAIGYQIQQCLANEMTRRRISKRAVTVVTQTVVDAADPAFKKPTKPIGSFYTSAEASDRQRVEGWVMVEDAGRGWRRVVASPKPLEIVETPAIKKLVDDGFVVIAVGGGGIPVARGADGRLSGCAAVIDKDFGSALLARDIGADTFLIQTAVEQVCVAFGQPSQKALSRLSVGEAREHLAAGQFPKGSMGPKIEACCQFLDWGGRRAVITSLEKMTLALEGKAGTEIVGG
ncbi:MAG: carbamate kinase [Candidatus Wallbacteria bacterium]|nr:carbamate kinase [Candidatus Wallbacteria bacterium]